MEKISPRKKLLTLLVNYWWFILIVLAILAFATDVPIFKYVLWCMAIIFALMIFAPVLFSLFTPAFFLIVSLVEHLKESKGESFGKRYVFVPSAIIASTGFFVAQSILSIWVFILSFLIWVSIIGFFFAFLTIFFFGLAPIAILTAPFVVWIQLGFAEFLSVIIFFLIALFWFGFSKMAFSEDYWKFTPEAFLGYSPHIFLLGALSFQVIAWPFYSFGLNSTANIISDTGGFLFLVLALIAFFRWRAIKKKLSQAEKENLYRPSAWIYIFGFFLTNLLYAEFVQKFGAPTAVLFWLNGFFLIAILGRFFSLFKRKKKNVQVKNEA